MDADEAWRREREFWTGEAGRAAALLDPECLMAFPGPAGLLAGAEAVERGMQGAPRWAMVEISDPHAAAPAPDLLVLAYRAEARREGTDRWRCLCTSTWRRAEAEWRLVQHQQTPA